MTDAEIQLELAALRDRIKQLEQTPERDQPEPEPKEEYEPPCACCGRWVCVRVRGGPMGGGKTARPQRGKYSW